MNADAESDQYNMSDLQYQPEMWTCLEILARHIKSIANQVRPRPFARPRFGSGAPSRCTPGRC